ncbi:dTDP-4-dehydrorhamnose 3,5-epimerase [Longispora fulva]|uniref:dTDP-4-dehydrorhamnose 3,5-epimerase n=1 Tax=Longispora fulva TaxID=619741 RepID=A0A8J7GCP2_9ACTN|nr:dTDP-4-dehydrorhamnose 3,5-epimerase [Longispora fulva]MBG6138138.1 dTDP-4-dehydrorhamnose 3,5-epimerase [Longispora fulva]GIG60391.1 dTDP-4-dehydrorhamnose 3,5-epimerase [Longispora fulva]
MKITPLGIDGAFEILPVQRGDSRGLFLEWYRHDLFAEANGHPLRLAQANLSVSSKGTVRGVHFADVGPGQAKYVTCVRGAVLDFVIDIRVGSPTFGQHEVVRLDDVDRREVYLAEGLGHAICALTDDATLLYLCSETYAPQREREVSPLDPALGLEFPFARDELILSDKDVAAPTLAEAAEQGLLPEYAACQKLYIDLKV